MLKTDSDNNDSLVMCQTSQGTEVRAGLVHMTRYLAVFEIYNPDLALCTSEVLGGFRIVLNSRLAFSGRAVVSKLVNTGTMIVCEAKLDEGGFSGDFLSALNGAPPLGEYYTSFLSKWQKLYRVRPEFKVVAADMQTFLADLRLWLEQAELEIRSAPAGDRVEMERRAARELGEAMVPAFDALHERLEDLSERIEEELRPVHQSFAKRQLHPLVMCSPFAYRTYHKPLGYAGDYEMVNMIARDPYEGSSLFAKVMNLWFLSQWPARAHRNRIRYLKELLVQESLRAARLGRPLRVLNLGCGPAHEVQEFLAQSPLCDHAQLTLLDFNEETVLHASRALEELKRRYGRRTVIQVQKRSVQHVLKESVKPAPGAGGKHYDLIYCAGLFDYLPDRTCRQLMNIFYDWLAPGGLVAGTNVDACKPFRHMLEFVLDWHLIYRNRNTAEGLLPGRAGAEAKTIKTDLTGVNVFLEARKSDHV
jgi:extracellular factor (EF) 3-hydroxypalmitic acid methyl ester biosynthesis protein